MKVEKKKNRNLGMKVLSVAIAILIWLLVANTNDPVITKRFADVPVQIENEKALTDNGYAYKILEGDKVTFTVKGKKSIVNNLNSGDFKVVADFSKLSLTDAIPIDITSDKFQDQLEINLGSTNTMKIEKDEIDSVNLPVNAIVNASVVDGYYVGECTTTPNLIGVTGPKSLLQNAKEIRATVDMDEIKENITVSAKPVLYSKTGETIENSQIEMDASSVNVSIVLWKTKDVKVNLTYSGDPASGYVVSSFDYEPKTVRVAVSEDYYDELESLDLKEVSLEGASENYENNIEIDSSNFPDGVILADNTTSIKISAKIDKVVTRKLTFSSRDLKVKNNPGYEISYSDNNKYFISVEGAESKIENAVIGDFAPWIDLSGLGEGTHDINVHVKDVDDISELSTSNIRITLRNRD